MTTRAWRLAALAVVAATLIVLLLFRRDGRESAAAQIDVGALAEAAPSVPPASVPVAEAPVESARAPVIADAAEPPAVAGEPAPAAPADELHGRVVGVDSLGRDLPPLDGSFELTLWRGNAGDSVSVEVRAGEWHAPLPDVGSIGSIQVDRLALGDRALSLVEPREQTPLPASRELVIRVQVPSALTLRVRDGTSGAELDGLRLVSPLGFPMDEATHPGVGFEARVFGRDLRSPIALDPFRKDIEQNRSGQILVGAPGYAWTFVRVELDRGGETACVLARGGDLELAVRGIDGPVKPLVRLRAAGTARPITEERLSGDCVLAFGGLAPGAYVARAETGHWFRSPHVFGESAVEVQVGVTTRAELLVTPPPRVERADIGGIVFIASEWEEPKSKRPMVVLEPLATPIDGSDPHVTFNPVPAESSRPGYRAYSWTRRNVELGKYHLRTFDPPFSVVIDVPAGGRSDFELVVPAPVELSVFVVDDATGEEVVTDRLLWNPRRPPGVDGGGMENAIRDAERHRFLVRAPACEIDLMVHDWGHLPRNERVDLTTGVREHTLRLQRACGITLSMKDGDTLAPFPSSDVWMLQLDTVAGGGKQSMTEYGDFERRIMVTEPGTYAIDMPALPGFLPVPRQTIEVFAGRFTQHVIRLERGR